MRAGDFLNAKVNFARAVALTPRNSAAHHNLGLAELRLGAYTPAAHYLREALDLAEGAGEERQELAARYNLALALLGEKADAAAEPTSEGSVRADAWDAESHKLAVGLAERLLSRSSLLARLRGTPEHQAMRGCALLLAAGIIRRRNQKLTNVAARGALAALHSAPATGDPHDRVDVGVVRASLRKESNAPGAMDPVLLERLVLENGDRNHLRVRYNHACYLAGLADDTSIEDLLTRLRDGAIEELDLALADGSLVQIARSDPALAPLLAVSPRARDVVARHGGEAVTASASLSSLDAIGEDGAEQLVRAGIADPLSLVRRADGGLLGRLAEEVGAPLEQLRVWTAAARLVVVLGVSSEHANLLHAAGVATLERVADADATRLLGGIVDLNARQSIAAAVPELWTVRSWIWRARTSLGL